jgi:hypothetical protein
VYGIIYASLGLASRNYMRIGDVELACDKSEVNDNLSKIVDSLTSTLDIKYREIINQTSYLAYQ